MITTQDAVDKLNEFFKRDPKAFEELINNRVPTQPDGLRSENCPVQVDPSGNVGLLGILNGLFGMNEEGRGYIAAQYNDSGAMTGFVLLK